MNTFFSRVKLLSKFLFQKEIDVNVNGLNIKITQDTLYLKVDYYSIESLQTFQNCDPEFISYSKAHPPDAFIAEESCSYFPIEDEVYVGSNKVNLEN